MVGVPGVAVLNRELAVPLPIGRFIDSVDMHVTALTDWNHIFNAIVVLVAVHVMEREFVLGSVTEIGVEPFVWGSAADHAFAAPAVEDCLFEGCGSHI